MPTYDLLSLREVISDQGILICFNGPFSHSIIEEIGTAVKKHLESDAAVKSAVHDVFAVYIEQTQNVRNYAARKNFPVQKFYSPIVIISKQEGAYAVSSGNLIEKGDVPDLLRMLQQVNSLDKDGLKKLYREKLRQEPPPGSQGAGVGLIDMARRASLPLKYSVNSLDETYDFFSLTVVV
jgi:hypothetical protein